MSRAPTAVSVFWCGGGDDVTTSCIGGVVVTHGDHSSDHGGGGGGGYYNFPYLLFSFSLHNLLSFWTMRLYIQSRLMTHLSYYLVITYLSD